MMISVTVLGSGPLLGRASRWGPWLKTLKTGVVSSQQKVQSWELELVGLTEFHGVLGSDLALRLGGF